MILKRLDAQGCDFLCRLGAKIRDLRERRQISQEKFAAQCGFDRTYISLVERGKRNLSIVNLCRIAQALGVDISELVADL